MAVTLKEIAKKAGVSPSTVSFAIRGKQPGNVKIPEKTVARICAVAKEMGYRPNRLATSLASNQTKMIGILVPALRGNFYERVFSGINQVIFPDFVPVLALHDYDASRERIELEVFMGNRLDGVIAAFSGDLQNIHLYRELSQGYGIPVVLVDREIPGLDLPIVKYDNYAMAYEAVKALHGLGHERILYANVVAKIAENLESIKQCEDGYRCAMSELNLEDQVRVITRSDNNHWTKEVLRQSARDILDAWQESVPRATAMMVNVDWLAYEILAECQIRQIKVPDDLSIMGMDDCVYSELTSIGLSSVRLKTDLETLGRKAAQLLLELIAGKKPQETNIVLPIEVVTRKTTQAV